VVVTELGPSGNLFNFKNADNAVPSDYTSYPVTAGRNSYRVYLRPKFKGVGSFNKINFCVLYKSLLINGETLIAKTKTTLNKQIMKIIVQLQRLSEETLVKLTREATV